MIFQHLAAGPLMVNCFILGDEASREAVVIDPGGSVGNIISILNENKLKLRYIINTHGHWDHIGSARDMKQVTGAEIALHQREKDWLEKALKSQPPGATTFGRIVTLIVKMFLPFVHIPATNVDIVLDDEGLSLSEYGIPGRIVHTPGHSPGSVSVLLETGDAFVGDLAMNIPLLRSSPGFPIFAEDMQQVKASWRRLLDEGVGTVYPAVGKPFSADIIREALL